MPHPERAAEETGKSDGKRLFESIISVLEENLNMNNSYEAVG